MAGTLTVDNATTDTIAGKSNANNMTINAGNITIKGEGSATTNLQQGLIKGWIRMNGTGTIAINDSFNYSSIADNGTGDYTVTLSTAMGNIFYSPTAGAGDVNYGAKIDLEHAVANTTTAMRLRTTSGVGAVGDTDLLSVHTAGDLA